MSERKGGGMRAGKERERRTRGGMIRAGKERERMIRGGLDVGIEREESNKGSYSTCIRARNRKVYREKEREGANQGELLIERNARQEHFNGVTFKMLLFRLTYLHVLIQNITVFNGKEVSVKRSLINKSSKCMIFGIL